MEDFGRSRDLNRYNRLEVLGYGAFGRVYHAYDTVNQTNIAMKKISLELDQEGVPTTVLREVCLLRELKHENIVNLLDVVPTLQRLFLIFEYLESDLRKYIECTQHIPESSLQCILRQILKAICFVHSRRFMHRDLKPENILIDPASLTLKVADFGLGRIYQIPGKPYTNEVQTLWYRAPEILLGVEQYSVAIDMWSVGCIFAELVIRRPLFRASSPYPQLLEIFSLLGTPSEADWPGVTSIKNFPAQAEYSGTDLRTLFPALSDPAYDLLLKLLTLDPARRISAKAALQHPFLSES